MNDVNFPTMLLGCSGSPCAMLQHDAIMHNEFV
jgi:hypothetical protein